MIRTGMLWLFLGLLVAGLACKQFQEKSQAYGERALQGLSDSQRLAIERDLSVLAGAILRYLSEQGHLPEGDIEAIQAELVPVYLARPITRTQGFPIRYQRFDDTFELRVAGADGQWETADDIVVRGP